MTPTIATILALAAAVWALAWWDIQRRKTVRDERIGDAESRLKALDARVSQVREQSGIRAAELDRRLESVERNPAAMTATKERMDVLEKAMAELTKQTKAELEEFRARTMTMSSRVDARRFGGARPNG